MNWPIGWVNTTSGNEYNGAPITSEDVADRKYDILRIFKRVKSFFEAQFSTGITFPDVAWEV